MHLYFIYFLESVGKMRDIANTCLYFCHVNFQVFVIFDHKTMSACSQSLQGVW